MSVLKVVKYGEQVLRTPAKEVHKISKKIRALIHDMVDTMYAQNGVGLAAPQVGESLRIFVIDVTDPDDTPNPIVFVNPKIVKKSGAVNSYEGCLSFPDAFTNVRRYSDVTVKALDINGKPFILEGKNGTLLARAIQHEFDHLEGILFVDHSRNRFEADQELAKKGLLPIEADKLIEENELEEMIAQQEAAKKEEQKA